MRQFSLTNKSGETYRLNDLKWFFHNPKGLGFTRNTTFQKIGYNYEILSDDYNQEPITGEIRFKSDKTSDAYHKYSAFTRFIQDVPLVVHYRVTDTEYLLDVIISSVDKTEINVSSGMNVKITIMPLSLWYQKIEKTASGTSITVISESAIESPCHVTFKPSAAITALTWTHAIDGVTKITGGLTGISVSTNQTLHIRTDTNPYKIYRNTEATNYYSKSDFSKKRFILLGKGTNVITFNTSGAIGVEGRILYETV